MDFVYRFADEHVWDDSDTLTVVLDFVKMIGQEQELERYLRYAAENP